MGVITFNNNSASLKLQGSVNRASDQVNTSLERLSTGMRINHAVDDAAGLSVAAKLSADQRIYTQAIRNIGDSISANSIASGTVSEIGDILIRIKELAEQSANGVYSTAQRRSMQNEATKLTDEFNRLLAASDFNGIRLLNGTLTSNTTQLNNSTLTYGMGQQLRRNVGTGSFTAGSSQGAATTRSDVAQGDINGDGKLDIVSTRYNNTTIYIQINNGDGTYTETTKASTTSNQRIALADMNGDGVLDIVAGGYTGSLGSYQAKLATFLGVGNGTFGAQVTSTFGSANGDAGSGFQGLTIADVTGDGVNDVAFTYFDGVQTNTYIARGATTGSFTQIQTFNDVGGSEVAPGGDITLYDVNGDGKKDFVSSASGPGWLLYFQNQGNGTFNFDNVTYTVLANGAGNAVFADVNRDGYADLIAASTASNFGVSLSNGDGTFQSQQTYSTTGSSGYIQVTDVNGDGIPDVVTSSSTALGRGDGTFGTAIAHNALARFVVGDATGDGAPDIVSAATGITVHTASTNGVTWMEYVSLINSTDAKAALTTVDSYMARVTSEQSALGAAQSRLFSAVNTIAAARDNFAAAYGQISDADIAGESSNLLRNQILGQTSTALLAQANQAPQIALSLLRDAGRN